MKFLSSFWKFSRPHTIIGTSLSVVAIYLIAIATTNSIISLDNLFQLIFTWIACLCGNVYIVGLNQLTDIAIDRINKPNLPLASGEFSPKQGWFIVGVTGVLAILIAEFSGFWLLVTVLVSLALGTSYSLPPLRLKRFPLLAALCIFTVRGIVINLGLFLHFTRQLLGKEILNIDVWLLSLFVLVFTVAIAIFKDVPDLEGDKKYNINTFTLILGKSLIFQITLGIITVCYLSMIGTGILQFKTSNSMFFIVYHLVLLAILWWRSRRVNLDDKNEIASFYQFIWKLFFLEYILFPISCFLN